MSDEMIEESDNVNTADPDGDAADLSLTASTVWNRLGVALGAATILALLASGVLAWMHHQDDQSDKDARKAAQVAATSLEELLSFTPQDVLEKADAESALMTGELKDTYTDQLKSDWGPAAAKNGIVTKAEVLRVGRASVLDDTVKLVVYANLSRTVAGSDQSDIITSTMLITMKRIDGDWLISEYKGV